ncbi:DUF3168 domain-containing protein [Sulfitobacter sabulilitoris]|uniref:DUF3168 domain-containing protein n=1 Tax=Sulfitobacter sabulilitoris TaxID=2562655 RepID=A0A5S3PJ32_9RHOB|nr:DUF3168 domain-containing protein [Sulfitobacter sabulilitoris]TMM54311.1 DUF3168 domain-containing protein [Sulfitobacter sabulilitoris]
MSYGTAGALQSAIYGALVADAALDALVSGAIYDAVPSGTLPETYVSLGRETARDASDKSGTGAVHQVDVVVITSVPGFAGAKAVAAAVSDVLHDADLVLSRGRLVSLRFERAQARRIEQGTGREIVLRFRARVEDE